MYRDAQYVIHNVPDFVAIKTLSAEALHGSPFDPSVNAAVDVNWTPTSAEDSGV